MGGLLLGLLLVLCLTGVSCEDAEASDLERDLIAESAACKQDFAVVQDICKLSSEAVRNNWAVLDCLQNPPQASREN
jgi:hypothetical protein